MVDGCNGLKLYLNFCMNASFGESICLSGAVAEWIKALAFEAVRKTNWI